MWQYIIYIFLAYLLFKLVFNFIIPVYKTTKQVRKGFKEMQEKMRSPQAGNNSQPPGSIKNNQRKPAGDYIDFEEVKQ